MLNLNNPAVNLETRRFLRSLLDDSHGIDEEDLRLLQRAIERVKDVSPSGWVHTLAMALGASFDIAIHAGSFSELYYAMCSFTDDVQDGDASQYMALEDSRLLWNTAAQLICVTVVRGEQLEASLRAEGSVLDMSQIFLDGVVMLRGQRIELERKGWSVESYRLVAELSAARQFDVYFRVASTAAGISPTSLLALSQPLGLIVQVVQDKASGDRRLLDLPNSEISLMLEASVAELRQAADQVPSGARKIVGAMVEFVCTKLPEVFDLS